MKLIIQIPCLNEEDTIAQTIADLPKQIDGIDTIEVLIINDGSTDNTEQVATAAGAKHMVSFIRNKGLANAFKAGIEKSLSVGADIIVNTDADNQYSGKDIAKLVKPIIDKKADVVVGDRQTSKLEHFSPFKRLLQRFGSKLVRSLAHVDIKDAVSGFRAYSREAALRINILTNFSYTIENLIQFGNQRVKIVSVPIKATHTERKSRLFKNIFSFVSNQLSTIIRVYATYRPLKVFSILGVLTILPAIVGFLRFLFFVFTSGGKGHIQSLVVSAALFTTGFLILLFGIIAELISNNRKLLEDILYYNKKQYFETHKEE